MYKPQLRTKAISDLFKLIVSKITASPVTGNEIIGDVPNIPKGICGQPPKSNGFQHDFRR